MDFDTGSCILYLISIIIMLKVEAEKHQMEITCSRKNDRDNKGIEANRICDGDSFFYFTNACCRQDSSHPKLAFAERHILI